jgi:succinyl-CoA synthetase beta subunit
VLVAESAEIAREIYFAILLDRATAAPVVVASTEGGVEIETVAARSPEKIIRESIDPLAGLQSFQMRKLAKQLAFDLAQLKAASKLFDGLFRTFIALDCSMVEVNPLVVTIKGEVLALDAKFNFDDNALYRHPDIAAMRDIAEEDPREVEASKHGLNYIGLDGNIACLVNGAGLAMATMDIIKFYGGNPANFLDVGGGATEEQVTEAFKILIADENVKAILVNIFGGIMKCDVIAQGIINAMKTVNLPVPLVVRLEGTNVDAGKKLIEESGLAVIAADDLADAAQKVVKEIGFVAIPVTDIKRARGFYEDVLGLKMSEEMMSGRWVEYAVGDDTLAIANVSDTWTPSDQGTGAAFEVEDFDDAIKRLKDRHVRFAAEPFETACCHMAVVQDPDGNKLMIHKLKPENEKGICS